MNSLTQSSMIHRLHDALDPQVSKLNSWRGWGWNYDVQNGSRFSSTARDDANCLSTWPRLSKNGNGFGTLPSSKSLPRALTMRASIRRMEFWAQNSSPPPRQLGAVVLPSLDSRIIPAVCSLEHSAHSILIRASRSRYGRLLLTLIRMFPATRLAI